MSFYFLYTQTPNYIVLRLAVGHSDGITEGGHQIGPQFFTIGSKLSSVSIFPKITCLNVQNSALQMFHFFCKIAFLLRFRMLQLSGNEAASGRIMLNG